VSRRSSRTSDAGDRRPREPAERPARGRRAFTILELEISLVVLMAGLLSITSLLSVQSRQMTRVESWCSGDPTFYVVSQSNHWLRRLAAPAQLETQAGQEAWTPPVSGTVKYKVLLDSWDANVDEKVGDAAVRLQSVDD
jgi:hypothetical protein